MDPQTTLENVCTKENIAAAGIISIFGREIITPLLPNLF